MVDGPAKIQVRKRGAQWLVRVPPHFPGRHDTAAPAAASDASRWPSLDEAIAFIRPLLVKP